MLYIGINPENPCCSVNCQNAYQSGCNRTRYYQIQQAPHAVVTCDFGVYIGSDILVNLASHTHVANRQ